MAIVKIRTALVALASSAALISGAVVLADPAAAASQQLGSPVRTVGSPYHWHDLIQATGEWAEMDVYWGADGHEYVDSYLVTSHQGQNLWVLTWNGSGWDWFGTPATKEVAGGWWLAGDFGRSDAGTTIKLAIYDWDTGRYIYTNAH
ncbi:hypothetical protein ACWGKU_15190 [Kitasatospora sp. NPDC054768]|uniref:hypothetical protein n=1 Tax=Kitasatospora sp. NBC_01519 TaxID=2903576 RepID=UPI002F913A47